MKNKNYKIGFIILGILIAAIIAATSLSNVDISLTRNFDSSMDSLKNYISEKFASKAGSSNKGNLVDSYEEYYSIVKEALDNYESTVTLTVKNQDKDLINENVFDKALESNPLGGAGYKCHINIEPLGSSKTTVKFEFIYPEPREELLKKAEEVRAKVKSIVASEVKPGMKDYEKEKVLHDYIVNNCKYDERYFTDNMPDESYSAYGLFSNGVAVCQGYAVAMNLLLEEAGIESMLITGEGYYEETGETMSHAWNLVKIGGEYYHLDPTWNDPVMEDGSDVIGYSYFNLTDEQIEVNHRWDKTQFPPCNATEFAFNNLNFVEKDSYGNDIKVVQNFNEFSEALVEDMKSEKTSITYKVIDFEPDLDTIERYIRRADEKVSHGGKVSYGYREDSISKCGYVTVEFIWN